MKKEVVGKDTDRMIEKAGKCEVELLAPSQKMSPFFSFHYSYKEISSVNGRTHIRSEEKRFANGKFESEKFEGTLGGHVYENMVFGMQKYFLNQMDMFLKPFSMFLPFGGSREKDKQNK